MQAGRGLRVPRVVACLAGVSFVSVAWIWAQTPKPKPKPKTTGSPAAVKQLDIRATQMQEQLLRDASDIAKGYEEAGEYDRAKWLLEVLEKLDPNLPGLKDKIGSLTDKSLAATEFEVGLDVSKGWTPLLGFVQSGRVVRVQAKGDYMLSVTLPATADGLPANDSGTELVGGIPVGALIGVIVDAKEKKPGKPFEIKAEREWTPRESGLLQLKVNLPSGHKSTGKLTVTLGGVAPLTN